jgi:hypothetical protein
VNVRKLRTSSPPTNCGDIRLQYISALVVPKISTCLKIPTFGEGHTNSYMPTSQRSFVPKCMVYANSTVKTLSVRGEERLRSGTQQRHTKVVQLMVHDNDVCFSCRTLEAGTHEWNSFLLPDQIFKNSASVPLPQHFIYLVFDMFRDSNRGN